MTIEEINKLKIDELQKDFTKILESLKPTDANYKNYTSNVDGWIKEYEMEHKVFDRPDKILGDDTIVEVVKLGIPMQKKVVNSTVAFLFGSPVKLVLNSTSESDEAGFDIIKDIWTDAKLDFHNKKLARIVFSESRAAELFYIRFDADKQKKVKVQILAKSEGDVIYPHWDDLGDMDAFIREYEIEIDEKKIPAVEIYTDDFNYICQNSGSWEIVKVINPIKKIPVIYYEQKEPEWNNVQSSIDRIEDLISKNADTNDYFGSPAIVSKGKLKTAPDKGEVGKFFEIEPHIEEGKATFGSLEYLIWDRAPEAIKLEYEILKDIVHSFTATPDLSFNNVKGTGNISGIALKFMFLDSILKSIDKQEIFGEGLFRRINLLKVIHGKAVKIKDSKSVLNLNISVEFNNPLPENISEIIDMLTTAVSGEPVMSQKTAVKINPLVVNPVEEVRLVESQAEKLTQLPGSYGT